MKAMERISDLKVEIMKRLLATDNEEVLDEIFAILVDAADEYDGDQWYENLDDEDKASIERGRADIAAGRVLNHKGGDAGGADVGEKVICFTR